MRNILFRGKQIKNGEWVEGNFILQFDHKKKEACGFITKQDQDFDKPDFNPVEIDIKTLGQFTGLCDKNGKKIFEGDILSDGAVVEWIENLVWDSWGSRHPGFYCKKWTMDEESELSWHFGFSKELEVIGNIFDNPELLEDV